MEGAGRLCQNGRSDLVTCAGPLKLSAPTRLLCDLPQLGEPGPEGADLRLGERVEAWEVERFPQGLTQR